MQAEINACCKTNCVPSCHARPWPRHARPRPGISHLVVPPPPRFSPIMRRWRTFRPASATFSRQNVPVAGLVVRDIASRHLIGEIERGIDSIIDYNTITKDMSGSGRGCCFRLCTICHHIWLGKDPRNSTNLFPGIQYNPTFHLSLCLRCQLCFFCL